MGGAVRITILAVSAPIAAFFFGIALHAVHIYLHPIGPRWSLMGLYRTGGGWIFPGLIWLAALLMFRRGLSPRALTSLLGLFIVATGLSVRAAHLAQDGAPPAHFSQRDT